MVVQLVAYQLEADKMALGKLYLGAEQMAFAVGHEHMAFAVGHEHMAFAVDESLLEGLHIEAAHMPAVDAHHAIAAVVGAPIAIAATLFLQQEAVGEEAQHKLGPDEDCQHGLLHEAVGQEVQYQLGPGEDCQHGLLHEAVGQEVQYQLGPGEDCQHSCSMRLLERRCHTSLAQHGEKPFKATIALLANPGIGMYIMSVLYTNEN